ncbi:MAG TPA: hypothetical protein VGU46_10995 [Acidobacteriaceae bacterium]|nr:hypothetical protein [Acidobacteriaceae bacterium]
MIVTLDNLDGAGAVDYSSALCADAPLQIERTLNQPSRCNGTLNVGSAANPGASPSLAIPVRRARLVVSSDTGTILFTGYLATEPVPEYVGIGVAGPVYRVAFSAISDEWLLDKQALTLGGDGFAVAGGTLLSRLTNRVEAGLLSTSGVVNDKVVGVFTPQPTQPWSANASGIAGSAYASYRVINGALGMQTVGSTTHALDFDSGDGGGSLHVGALKTAMVKELANDVTISGEIEPSAYVTEMFSGDGTTTVFTLSQEPFRITRPALLSDSFNLGAFNTQLWNVTDPGSHMSLGGGGLTLSGGTGSDGQTTLTAIDPIELGGSLVLEAGHVQFGAPSDGVLCGLYAGPVQRGNCFAGYNVRQSGGSTLLTPYVNGSEMGTSYTLLNGHTYTLRIRLHSPEMQRVQQTYYARVDGVIESFGGGLVASPVSCVFELVDLGNASNTPATVLYDGSVTSSPASCTFAAVDSITLTGSIGFCSVTQNGSAWIVSTLPGGTKQTRLIGVAGQGVDCALNTNGVITFFAGRIPVAGEFVTVSYRTRTRSIARLEDPASVAAEAAGGIPGTARWLGKVVRPLARSSEDCEAAAEATLALASSRAAAIAGSYAAVNPADVWPGDVLAITANGQTLNVVVRTVAIADGHAKPELLTYRIAFANDWAEALGLTLSEAIATDAYLPTTAAAAPAQVLANLQQLTVQSATTSALQIDAGTAPPAGGGFEVRLRDFDFGAGVDQNLVLRSPVRSFSIPRTAQVEHYYVRMYDASTPPLYSRHSSAIFTNLPVA